MLEVGAGTRSVSVCILVDEHTAPQLLQRRYRQSVQPKGGYTLVTLPRIVTPYRDSVDETRARVTYQKMVKR